MAVFATSNAVVLTWFAVVQTPLNAHAALCRSDLDCSGSNGHCIDGSCQCKAGWSGEVCNVLKFVPNSGRVAYNSSLWTWCGSPILGDDGLYHLFSSVISQQCGILHYCMNSFVAHLTSPNATGPYTHQSVALPPRADAWDNGATHDITVHRLPNKTYALFYMGAMQPGMKAHPNCTEGSGDSAANKTTGSHNGRRIGVALSETLDGPWRRLSAPIFGPDSHAWDNIDVSNPSPIIHKNGSVVLLYKGRGSHMQHMGLAFADSIDGPYLRNNSGLTAPDLPGEDPFGWIDPATGVYHAVFHDGNGAHSAGAHRWSVDGVRWYGGGSSTYTGAVQWSAGTGIAWPHSSVLARRERPQMLLDGEPGSSYGRPQFLFTSAEDCVPRNGQSDAGNGRACANGVGTDKSYTMLEAIDLSTLSATSTLQSSEPINSDRIGPIFT